MDVSAAPVVPNEDYINEAHNVSINQYKANSPAPNYEPNNFNESNNFDQNVFIPKVEANNIKNEYANLVINENYTNDGLPDLSIDTSVEINDNISNGISTGDANISEQEELEATCISDISNTNESIQFVTETTVSENSLKDSISEETMEIPTVIEEKQILTEEHVIEEVIDHEVNLSQESNEVIEEEVIDSSQDIAISCDLNESSDSVNFQPELVKTDELQEIVVTQAELLSVPDPNMQYRIIPQELEDGTLVVEYTISEAKEDDQDEIPATEESGVQSDDSKDIKPTKELHDAKDPDYVKNESQEEPKTPKPKGRKRTMEIPMHILGHNIEKPSEDVMHGKGVLKPRLGVKVPYRTLSSQMVSKAELEGEILKSAKEKQKINEQESLRTSFTRKMTHRLAQSISGIKKEVLNNKEKAKEKSAQNLDKDDQQSNEKTEIAASPLPTKTTAETIKEPKEILTSEEVTESENKNEPNLDNNEDEKIESKKKPKIESNQDLIAILEGNDEDHAVFSASNNVSQSNNDLTVSSDLKEIEKEISQTPKLSETSKEGKSEDKKNKVDVPKTKKFFKSRDSSSSKSETKENSKHTSSKSKTSSSDKNDVKFPSTSKKDNTDKVSSSVSIKKEDSSKSKTPKDKKVSTGPIEVEPQLKASMVMKTYSRKRKSTDLNLLTPPVEKKAILEEIPPAPSTSHNDFVLPTPPPNTYVTKSSRVIKKKVIWDPDEAFPSKASQAKILNKIESSTKIKTPEKSPANEKKIEKEKKVTPKEVKATPEKAKKLSEKDKRQSSEKIEKEIKAPVEKEKKIIVEKKQDKEVTNASKKSPTNKKVIVVSADMINASPKKRKYLSEIDKLLMDEGAVNMLYDINASDEQKFKNKNQSVISLDKAQKELVNKAMELKNELTANSGVESPVKEAGRTLRKKELGSSTKKEVSTSSAISGRKMSKDSSKSSVHSPPPSPSSFAETSRIIRRHSSSDSFSSLNEEVPAVDLDKSTKPNDQEKTTKKKSLGSQSDIPKKKARKDNESPLKVSKVGVKVDPDKSFIVIKRNKQVSIELTYAGNESYFSPLMLKELTIMLKELAKMKDCNVVYIHSRNSDFCLGLDYKGLIETNKELRKKRAVELASYVREFIKTLLNFPKVLVAGVQGACVGLGTTILPLFDFVVASDAATFSTPYSRLGCSPEGGFCFRLSNIAQGLVSEILFTNQKVSAEDAQKRGLVSKLYWPEKFDAELNKLMNNLGKMSTKGLEECKKQLHLLQNPNLESVLQNLTETLTDSWVSQECQENFEGYSAKN